MNQKTEEELIKINKEKTQEISKDSKIASSEQAVFAPEIKEKKSNILRSILIGLVCAPVAVTILYLFYSNYVLRAELNMAKTDLVKINKVNKELVPKLVATLTPQQQIPTLAPLSEIRWLASPQTLTSVKVFKPEDRLGENTEYLTDEAKFTKTADFSDGSILINSIVQVDSPAGDVLFRFIKTKDGIYYCLDKHSGYSDSGCEEYILDPQVGITNNEIADLVPPDKIEIGDKKLTKGYSSYLTFSDLANPQKILDTDYGSIYRTNVAIFDRQDIFVRANYLRLKDYSLAQYNLNLDFFTKDSVPQITWTGGTSNENSFRKDFVSGCGLGGKG